jgi:hypothetical protein
LMVHKYCIRWDCRGGSRGSPGTRILFWAGRGERSFA